MVSVIAQRLGALAQKPPGQPKRQKLAGVKPPEGFTLDYIETCDVLTVVRLVSTTGEVVAVSSCPPGGQGAVGRKLAAKFQC